MRKYLLLFLLLVGLGSTAFGQATIPVSGTKVIDNIGQPLGGTLVFTVTDTTDTPVTYTPQGGSPTTATIAIPVSAGVVQRVGGQIATIPNPLTMSPANTRYRMQAYNFDSTLLYTLPLININTAGWSFDSYVVPLGVSATGMGRPQLPCAPGAQYTQTDQSYAYPWICSRNRNDGNVYWTLNPVLPPLQCPQPGMAYVSSTGLIQPFCVDSMAVYATPGVMLGVTGSQPGPFQVINQNSGVLGPSAPVIHQFITGVDNSGNFLRGQAGFSDLSGSLAVGQLPAMTGDVIAAVGTGFFTLQTIGTAGACGDSTHVGQVSYDSKGRVISCTPIGITAAGGTTPAGPTSHQFLTSVNNAGVFTLGQPGFSDLSGNPTSTQIAGAGLLSNSTSGNAGTATQLATTPAQCPSGQVATGISANGTANCTTSSANVFSASHGLVYNTSQSTSMVASSSQVAATVQGATNCTTSGYAWSPATNTCVPVSGGGSSLPHSFNIMRGDNAGNLTTSPYAPANCTGSGVIFTAHGCANVTVFDDGTAPSPTATSLTGWLTTHYAYGPVQSNAGAVEGRSSQVRGDYGTLATAGIKNIDQSDTTMYGVGDALFYNWVHNCHAGVAFPSDQGCQLIYNWGGQGNGGGHYNSTVPPGQGGTGVTSLALNQGSGCNDPLNQNCIPAPGTQMLDGAAVATGKFTAPSGSSSHVSWLQEIATDQTTLPTSATWGYNPTVSVAGGSWDSPVTTTITLPNQTGGSFAAGDLVCAMGDEFEEQTTITSVSGPTPGQSITLPLARPENKIALFKGGCKFVQLSADAALNDYSVYPAVSIDGAHWIYGVPSYGNFGAAFPATGVVPETYDGTANAAFSAFCGARVTKLDSVFSPFTTHLEPNGCAWNVGDAIQTPDFSAQKVNGFINNAQQFAPSTSAASLSGIINSIDGMGASGSAVGIENDNFFSQNCSAYAVGTCGGKLTPPTAHLENGVWGQWFNGNYTPASTLFYFNNHFPGQTSYTVLRDPSWGQISLDNTSTFHFVAANVQADQSIFANGIVQGSNGLSSGIGNGSGNLAGVEFKFPAGGGLTSTWLAQCTLNPFSGYSSDLCVTSQGNARSTYAVTADRALQADHITLTGAATPGAAGYAKFGAGTLQTPAASYALFSADGSGDGILSENGASFSRICTAGNSSGVSGCGGGGGGFSSPTYKYASLVGCTGGVDLNTGNLSSGGTPTDQSTCIQTALAGATPQTPIVFVDDVGGMAVSKIVGPAAGGWGITGGGGGIQQIPITAWSITSNVATFTTPGNATISGNTQVAQVGQWVTLGGFGTSTFFNGQLVKVTAATATSFTVSFTHVDGSATETAEADSIYGSGLWLINGSNNNVVSNTPYIGDPHVATPMRGSGYQIKNLVINGNRANNSGYNYGIALNNAADVLIDSVVLIRIPTYAIMLSNDRDVRVTNSSIWADLPNQPSTTSSTHQDGIHVDGPGSNFYFANLTIESFDDPIAFNAPEGYCGPITGGEVSNVNLVNALTLGRLDPGPVCANGQTPTVSNITFDQYNGNSTASGFILGNETSPSGLANAITQVKVSNSNLSSPQGFIATDNVGDFTLQNVTWTPTCNNCGVFMTAANVITVAALTESNVTLRRTSSSQTGVSLVDLVNGDGAGAGTPTITRLTLAATRMVDTGTSFPSSTYALNVNGSSTISHLYSGTNTDLLGFAGLYNTTYAARFADFGIYQLPGQLDFLSANGGTAVSRTSLGTSGWFADNTLAPNLSTGQYVSPTGLFGVGTSTNNSAYLRFLYNGSGSTSNAISLGFFGNDDLFEVAGTGIVTAKGLSMSGNGSTSLLTLASTGSSSWWASSVLAPSLSTGSFVSATGLFGVAAGDMQAGYLRFLYNGSGSTGNKLSLGFFNHDDLVTLDGTGELDVNGGATMKISPIGGGSQLYGAGMCYGGSAYCTNMYDASSGSAITTSPHITYHSTGDSVFASGTLTITFSVGPSFASATTYSCTANDVTAANPIQVVYNSGTSVTFNGTGTDHFRYACVGE